MIGRVIDGEFKIVRLIGMGAFGSVYEAEEISLKRTVAVKMLNRETAGEKNLQRFLKEAQHLARLDHENVVRINRLGEFDGNPFIVMELLTGRSLKSIMEGPQLPLGQALRILAQVCSGLQAIHSLGIVHRDLSKNNIMVTDSGAVKILDLGLAKEIQPDYANQEQYLAGTIAYVSPEQVEGKGASFASDVFALGVISYELLTGKHPFHAEHYMSVLYNIVHRDPEPLEMHVQDCPIVVSRIVTQCLEKQPEDRPQKAEEVEKVLNEVVSTTDSQMTLSGTVDLPQTAAKVTLSNPYLNRVMIKRRDEFFGRVQEVRRIYARLNATPPGSVSIVGDRKIGKSSLLNYVYARQNRNKYLEQPEKMVMVFLDLQQRKDMTLETFVSVLLSMAGYELRGRLDVSDCSNDLDGVRNMVQRLDENGYRLGIILDEFEAITKNENFDLEFFSFLRFLANHYNVAYLTSSAHDLQALCHTKEISDSPFFNIFSSMRLSAFQRKEAEELIRVPSERIGKPLAPHAGEIMKIAGLFPFFIQIACGHCLEYLDDNPDETTPDFEEVHRRFYDEAELHYKYMWTTFDTHERSAMTRVVAGKSIPDDLRHVLGELSRRNYIQSSDASPKLFSMTFEEFVKTCDHGKKKSLFGRLLRRS